jgi:hypothetical protein
MNGIITTIRLQFNESGKCELIICPDRDIRREYAECRKLIESGHKLAFEVKEYKKRRSLDANSYCWVLCQKLAEKLGSGHTKETIYKEAVRKAGQFDFVAVSDAAVESFIKAWECKGIGWYAEASESKIDGCKKIMVYYGSSVYDTSAMAHLIDYIVSECREQGIPILEPWEVEKIKKEWGK